MTEFFPKPSTRLSLHGVHHSARPTWKLRETVEFYRDKLGLPLLHAVSARGWGRENHPDFVHFFFDSGNGSTIAFFYYLGTERPDWLTPRPDDTSYRATHTAWHVQTRDELVAWKEHLEAQGLSVSPYTKHEMLESIYTEDPNGYSVEITLATRAFQPIDSEDATRTLEAAMALEDAMRGVRNLKSIDDVWRRKAQGIGSSAIKPGQASIYVLNVPEFRCLVEDATRNTAYLVSETNKYYFRIDAEGELHFNRKQLNVKPAIWYSLFTGGLYGRIIEFSRDDIRIIAS